MVTCAALALYCSTVSPAAAMRRRWKGVKIGPGPTAFTRMPSGEWIGGERPRQARDRGLSRVVLQVPAARHDGTHGGDVNDGTALVAAHQRNRRLGTEDVAHQVDVEDLVPARRARLVDLLVFADAGVVDEDVEAPELLRGTVDEGEACGLGTNVSLREGDLGAAVSSSAATHWPRPPSRSEHAT